MTDMIVINRPLMTLEVEASSIAHLDYSGEYGVLNMILDDGSMLALPRVTPEAYGALVDALKTGGAHGV